MLPSSNANWSASPPPDPRLVVGWGVDVEKGAQLRVDRAQLSWPKPADLDRRKQTLHASLARTQPFLNLWRERPPIHRAEPFRPAIKTGHDRIGVVSQPHHVFAKDRLNIRKVTGDHPDPWVCRRLHACVHASQWTESRITVVDHTQAFETG